MNKSFFFNADTTSGSADITYSAADLAAEKAAYFSDGVLAPDDFKVSAVDSLTVKIAPGGAVLGGYTYVNSSIGVRAISSAAATKARRDLCVLKLDLSIRAMTVVIKSGMPSDANRYDFEMIGGGGAGGCCGHSDSRGGGGGAGAYVSVCGVTLSHGTHKIKIGAGGSGSAERSGGDGGESSFAGYHAPGGSGGVGGTWAEGMSFPGGKGGAVGAYIGERGGDGGYSLPSDKIASCGIGAPSPFGAGGAGVSGSSSSGKKGIGAGSGGSGGGCVSTSFSASGGNGADGCLLIYGYHTTAFGTAAE